MKRKIVNRSNKGFTILEVLVASSVLSMVIAGSMALQTSVMQTTRRSNDRGFASEKVMQMFDEIRSHVEGSQEDIDTSISTFSDGAEYNLILTTNKNAAYADDALSQNTRIEGNWRFTRKVQIDPLPNDQFARRVTVSMWYADEDGKPANVDQPLATITGILKTNIPRNPPTQVYDFFVLSIGNVPSWWSNLYDFKPAYDAVFGDLEFRNPGLKLRKRYISNLGYGRDPFYLPHTNTADVAHLADLPWSYYYPGRVTVTNMTGNPEKQDFSFNGISSRIRGDEDETIFHAAEKGEVTQYRPFAMADEFNQVLRWPEQKAAEARVFRYASTIPQSAVIANPELATVKEALKQPTLTSFLQGMNDGDFRNSMVSNMHAELTPLAPVINYSYAAKVPLDEREAALSTPTSPEATKFRNKRIVSHPEMLFHGNGETRPINLRIYGYEMPEFGCELDRKRSGANCVSYSTDELIQRGIEHTTVFIPTDGNGRSAEDASKPGFLDNPTLTPDATTLAESGLSINKIIGNSRLDYKWRQGNIAGETAVLKNTRRSRYLVSTDQDVWVNGESNADVQIVGRLSERLDVGSGETWLAFHATNNPTSGDSTGSLNDPTDRNVVTASTTDSVGVPYRNLIGDYIRLNAYKSSAGAALSNNTRTALVIDAFRDTGIPSSISAVPAGVKAATGVGSIYLRVVENPTTTPSALSETYDLGTTPGNGALVTRHRDYEIETNIANHFGQQRNGVLIHLFNTPTRHPHRSTGGPNPGNNTGLPPVRRLYGLEYIPAPVNHGTTNTISPTPNDPVDNFTSDLANTFANTALYSRTGTIANSDGIATRARNTARWQIQFAPTGTFESELEDKTLTFETRIIGGQNTRELKSPTFETYLEDGLNGDNDLYQLDNPTTTGLDESTLMRMNPYNVSRTYVYRGTSFEEAVPEIEQTQYIGDPRYLPYADVKQRGGYNTAFFCPESNPTAANASNGCDGNRGFGFQDGAYRQGAVPSAPSADMGGYDGYGDHTGQYSSVGAVDVDVTKAFRLYIDGIMRSNSIYNTIAGYTNYIISLGGGIGQRGGHTYLYNVKRSPWESASVITSTDNGEGNTVTSERGSGGHLRMISATTPANDNLKWTAFPYTGDMFPDEAYTFWKENGNLPNSTFDSGTHGSRDLDGDGDVATIATTQRFFRNKLGQTPFALGRRERITAEGAISDFYNGSGTTTDDNRRIKHSTSSGKGWLQKNANAAGRYLSDAFNMSLPDQIDSNRSFCIDSGACSSPNGTNSTAYTTTLARQGRNTVKYLNITGPQKGLPANTASEFTSFYRYHDGASTTPNLNVASGLIKMTREATTTTGGVAVAANPDLVGYAVINGLVQGSDFGAQSLSRLAQAATLQAFLEGGDRTIPGSANGRVVMLPRMEIIQPNANAIQTSSSTTVEFEARWLRWDLKRYSPSYPNDWYDTAPLQFNAIYSSDNGLTWKYVNTNTPVPSEQMGKFNENQLVTPVSSYVMGSPIESWTFDWDTSGFNGNYLLRIEAYREGYDVGYSYHELFLTYKP